MATIPKGDAGPGCRPAVENFTDLLVSSQTGSSKTAAFLFAVLHTLLMQQEQTERDS
jgi:superfamily II DNA/RNA helicase